MKRNNVLANLFQNPPIHSILLLFLGLALTMAGIYFNKILEKDSPAWIDLGMTIVMLGEGFDSACTPKVDMKFDDKGNIELGLNLPDSETEPQNMWLLVISADIPFTWTAEGNIENRVIERDSSGRLRSAKNEQTYEDETWITYFYVKLDNDERKEKIAFQIPEEHVSYQCRENIKIMTPHIGSLYPDEKRYQAAMETLDDMKLEQIPTMDLKELTETFLAAGEIDGILLLPAVPNIDCVYSPEKYLPRSGYKLEYAAPSADAEYRNMLEWHSRRFSFWPAIEYTDKKLGNLYSIVKFLLLSVGAYLFSMSAEKILVSIFQSRSG